VALKTGGGSAVPSQLATVSMARGGVVKQMKFRRKVVLSV